MNSILAKYPMYIGTRNNADVPSMTEYMHRDTRPTSPKQLDGEVTRTHGGPPPVCSS